MREPGRHPRVPAVIQWSSRRQKCAEESERQGKSFPNSRVLKKIGSGENE